MVRLQVVDKLNFKISTLPCKALPSTDFQKILAQILPQVSLAANIITKQVLLPKSAHDLERLFKLVAGAGAALFTVAGAIAGAVENRKLGRKAMLKGAAGGALVIGGLAAFTAFYILTLVRPKRGVEVWTPEFRDRSH